MKIENVLGWTIITYYVVLFAALAIIFGLLAIKVGL